MVDTPTKLPPDLQRRSEAATVQLTEANARKAVAEAGGAEDAAGLARLKATIGDPAAAPFSGEVKLDGGGALAEANCLARGELSKTVESEIEGIRKAISGRRIVLVTSADGLPDTSHHSALTRRVALVRDAAAGARQLSDAALGLPAGADDRMLLAPLAAAGLVLSGVASVIGYFKTDFAVGGDDLRIADRDLLLMVGETLRSVGVPVLVDGAGPAPSEALEKELGADLAKLSAGATLLRGRIARHTSAIASIDAPAQAPAMPVPAPAPEGDQAAVQPPAPVPDGDAAQSRDAHEQAMAACCSAVTLHEALVTSLDADAGGLPFVERALRERTLAARLGSHGAVLSVRMDGSWATHVVRKGLFTGLFGRAPLQVSACIGFSWAAYDASAGDLLGGGVATGKSPLQDALKVRPT